MKLSKSASRIAFLVMPFQWIYRGCFDWQAARVAWRLAFSKRERGA